MRALAADWWIGRPGKAFAVLLLAIFVLGPFAWIAIVSVSPERDLFVGGVRYLPSRVTVDNYTRVIGILNFGRAGPTA